MIQNIGCRLEFATVPPYKEIVPLKAYSVPSQGRVSFILEKFESRGPKGTILRIVRAYLSIGVSRIKRLVPKGSVYRYSASKTRQPREIPDPRRR